MRVIISYKIYWINEDGLLKHPMEHGEYIFNKYGYGSQEEAIEAIKKVQWSGDLSIITCTTGIYYD